MLYVNDTFSGELHLARCFERFEKHPILGACRGKRLAVCIADPAFWIALCLYARERGASVFPLPPDLPIEAARRRAERSGSHYLLFGRQGDAALAAIERIGGEDLEEARAPGLVQTSSGTTGEPKIIERPWASIDTEVASYVQHFDPAHELRPIVACPVNHSYGLISGVLVGLKRGKRPIIIDNLNPKYILRKLYETPSALLYSSPALIATITMLVSADKPIHAVMTSGALMQRAWFDGVRRKVRHLHQQYGCSEAGCVVLGQDVAAPNQLGAPLPHVELAAGAGASDPREIVLRLPGAPAVETRDLGYLEAGNLYFVSRLDDMINVSGLKVYPAEVEEVVLEMPEITDAVVYKRSHGLGNEQVCLSFVSRRPVTDQQIRQWCSSRLASYQVPMSIHRLESIPRLPNGKISRKALSEAAS